MRQPNEIGRVLDELRLCLAGWEPVRAQRSVRTPYTCPPVFCDFTFAEVPLSNIMIPPCYTPIPELERMFGELVWWIHAGSPDGEKQYVLRDLRGRAKLFVSYSPERFLHWAGTHPEVTLERDDDKGYLMAACEATFGLADAKAYSSENVVDYVRRPHGLDKCTKHHSRERAFVSLWTRARELKDKGAQRALAAIRAWHATPMIKITPWVAMRDEGVDSDTIGALINEAEDPVGAIYSYLVPARLTREQFERHVAPLEGRKSHLNVAERRTLWTLLRRTALI